MFITFLIGAIISTAKLSQAFMTADDKNNNGKIDGDEKGEYIVESKLQSS